MAAHTIGVVGIEVIFVGSNYFTGAVLMIGRISVANFANIGGSIYSVSPIIITKNAC